jgi:uncharacterized membrane protein YfcA
MDSPPLILPVLTILFLSTLTRSTFGFGDALVAMPLLTLLIGIKIASPLVALFSTTIALVIVGGNWRSIDLKAAWRLILASLVGIPFGLMLLKLAPEAFVKGILGGLLILFGLYNLSRPVLPALDQPGWAYGFGFVAGVLGGAYNTNGPPVVIYGAMRRWLPTRFRATLQGYFVPTGGLIAISHGLGGLWSYEVLRLYLLALPLVLIAIFLGGKLNRRFPPGRFEKFLYLALILLGLLLII